MYLKFFLKYILTRGSAYLDLEFFTDIVILSTVKLGKEDLSKKTTIRIGPVVNWIQIESVEDLSAIDTYKKQFSGQFWIGNGSNLLVSDAAENLLFISLSGKFNLIEYDGQTVIAGAGVKISTLLDFCIKNGLSGLEWMAGIPATVGGAIFMNAGVGVDCILNHIKSIDCLIDGRIAELREFDFEYRKGIERKILSAKFEFCRTDKAQVYGNFEAARAARIKRQPSGRSFGSIFKNPHGLYAGKLIEECGLKGMTSGEAVISERHANFIINRTGASFDDVYNLILEAEKRVYEKFGIILAREVKIV